MILPTDFEARTVDLVRRCTRDIAECDSAQISVVFQCGNPVVRFAFGDPRFSRPLLMVGLLGESKKNPLAPGRLITEAELERHVRTWVEEYLKLNGIEITTKVVTDACL